MKNTSVILPIILVLVGLGAGFFGGYQYRNYVLNKTRAGFAGGAGAQRFVAGGTRGANGTRTGGAGFGGAVTGSILSIDTGSMTVKMSDGSTKIVLLSGSTTYSNTVSAAQTDLKVGSQVAAFGTANSDGSVTATSIQINPEFGRPMASPSPTPAAK